MMMRIFVEQQLRPLCELDAFIECIYKSICGFIGEKIENVKSNDQLCRSLEFSQIDILYYDRDSQNLFTQL